MGNKRKKKEISGIIVLATPFIIWGLVVLFNMIDWSSCWDKLTADPVSLFFISLIIFTIYHIILHWDKEEGDTGRSLANSKLKWISFFSLTIMLIIALVEIFKWFHNTFKIKI